MIFFIGSTKNARAISGSFAIFLRNPLMYIFDYILCTKMKNLKKKGSVVNLSTYFCTLFEKVFFVCLTRGGVPSEDSWSVLVFQWLLYLNISVGNSAQYNPISYNNICPPAHNRSLQVTKFQVNDIRFFVKTVLRYFT